MTRRAAPGYARSVIASLRSPLAAAAFAVSLFDATAALAQGAPAPSAPATQETAPPTAPPTAPAESAPAGAPRPPAAYPPSAYPAGTYPPGTYPPGTYPPGAYPPGAYPAGARPPEMTWVPFPPQAPGDAEGAWVVTPAGGAGSATPGGVWVGVPAPAEAQKPSTCCRWSLRYDPFDLLFRRITVIAEVALGKLPFTIEATPKYIFDSPEDALDEKGFSMGGSIAWYPGGRPLRGLWLKAHAEYESFQATLTRDGGTGPIGKPGAECDKESKPGTCTRKVSSPVLGLMIGSTQVFGKNGGFAISGGIGVGAALSDPVGLSVGACTAEDVANKDPNCSAADAGGGVRYDYYADSARVRLLGTLGLGLTF